jgi:hypothetical protein
MLISYSLLSNSYWYSLTLLTTPFILSSKLLNFYIGHTFTNRNQKYFSIFLSSFKISSLYVFLRISKLTIILSSSKVKHGNLELKKLVISCENKNSISVKNLWNSSFLIKQYHNSSDHLHIHLKIFDSTINRNVYHFL